VQAAVEPVSSLHLFGGAVFGEATDENLRVRGVDGVVMVDSSLYVVLLCWSCVVVLTQGLIILF
jgi:hypothetical protein